MVDVPLREFCSVREKQRYARAASVADRYRQRAPGRYCIVLAHVRIRTSLEHPLQNIGTLLMNSGKHDLAQCIRVGWSLSSDGWDERSGTRSIAPSGVHYDRQQRPCPFSLVAFKIGQQRLSCLATLARSTVHASATCRCRPSPAGDVTGECAGTWVPNPGKESEPREVQGDERCSQVCV